jgi:hypothetical protein
MKVFRSELYVMGFFIDFIPLLSGLEVLIIKRLPNPASRLLHYPQQYKKVSVCAHFP